MRDFITFILVMVCFFLLIITPLTYLRGKTNQELLINKGIEMHWIKAAFVPDTFFINISEPIKITKGD